MYNIIAMKKTIISVVIALTMLFSIMSVGCYQTTSVHTFNYFNTAIRLESHSKPLTSAVINQLDDLFSDLEARFDANKKGSLLYEFNISPAGYTIKDQTIAQLTDKCKQYHLLTNGKFNPAIRPLISLWQFDTYPTLNFTPPQDEQILEAKLQSNFDNVIVDANEQAITKKQNYTKLDFGGVLKGYAIDLALEILQSQGYDKGYINMGGSSIALLNVDTLSIRHPRPTNYSDIVVNVKTSNLKNQIVSTSGDYEKYYNYQGVRYSHIIDTSTGKPIDTGIMSVTLIGLNGALGDALSTAICAMRFDETSPTTCELSLFLTSLSAQYPKCAYYVFYKQDDVSKLITNKKQGEDFTLLDNQFSIVNL